MLKASPESIGEAAEILRRGGIVAFPTETVYGLGANALNREAVARIYAIKQRPRTSPLIVHVNSVEMARGLSRDWPEAAQTLARAYWPGPLTLVVNKNDLVPDELTAGLGTVGLRMPAHPVALALIAAAGVPLAAPSANRFTELSPVRAGQVQESLGEGVELILDGGVAEVGIESTVVSVAGPELVLLRPGRIGRGEIEALVGRLREAEHTGQAGQAHAAPGMHARHYAPRKPLYVWRQGEEAPAPGRGLLLSRGGDLRGAESRSMPAAAAAYASRLYDELHEAGKAPGDWIAVEAPPLGEEWAAVWDRLRRATAR
ncbi:MAG: threonylcarbamoyl-AMP synthase [Bryobacter sp.]|nr:threonylcarbamoyl-AMP synthase [Bryobacter sp. CoA8 C33]